VKLRATDSMSPSSLDIFNDLVRQDQTTGYQKRIFPLYHEYLNILGESVGVVRREDGFRSTAQESMWEALNEKCSDLSPALGVRNAREVVDLTENDLNSLPFISPHHHLANARILGNGQRTGKALQTSLTELKAANPKKIKFAIFHGAVTVSGHDKSKYWLMPSLIERLGRGEANYKVSLKLSPWSYLYLLLRSAQNMDTSDSKEEGGSNPVAKSIIESITGIVHYFDRRPPKDSGTWASKEVSLCVPEFSRAYTEAPEARNGPPFTTSRNGVKTQWMVSLGDQHRVSVIINYCCLLLSLSEKILADSFRTSKTISYLEELRDYAMSQANGNKQINKIFSRLENVMASPGLFPHFPADYSMFFMRYHRNQWYSPDSTGAANVPCPYMYVSAADLRWYRNSLEIRKDVARVLKEAGFPQASIYVSSFIWQRPTAFNAYAYTLIFEPLNFLPYTGSDPFAIAYKGVRPGDLKDVDESCEAVKQFQKLGEKLGEQVINKTLPSYEKRKTLKRTTLSSKSALYSTKSGGSAEKVKVILESVWQEGAGSFERSIIRKATERNRQAMTETDVVKISKQVKFGGHSKSLLYAFGGQDLMNELWWDIREVTQMIFSIGERKVPLRELRFMYIIPLALQIQLAPLYYAMKELAGGGTYTFSLPGGSSVQSHNLSVDSGDMRWYQRNISQTQFSRICRVAGCTTASITHNAGANKNGPIAMLYDYSGMDTTCQICLKYIGLGILLAKQAAGSDSLFWNVANYDVVTMSPEVAMKIGQKVTVEADKSTSRRYDMLAVCGYILAIGMGTHDKAFGETVTPGMNFKFGASISEDYLDSVVRLAINFSGSLITSIVNTWINLTAVATTELLTKLHMPVKSALGDDFFGLSCSVDDNQVQMIQDVMVAQTQSLGMKVDPMVSVGSGMYLRNLAIGECVVNRPTPATSERPNLQPTGHLIGLAALSKFHRSGGGKNWRDFCVMATLCNTKPGAFGWSLRPDEKTVISDVSGYLLGDTHISNSTTMMRILYPGEMSVQPSNDKADLNAIISSSVADSDDYSDSMYVFSSSNTKTEYVLEGTKIRNTAIANVSMLLTDPDKVTESARIRQLWKKRDISPLNAVGFKPRSYPQQIENTLFKGVAESLRPMTNQLEALAHVTNAKEHVTPPFSARVGGFEFKLEAFGTIKKVEGAMSGLLYEFSTIHETYQVDLSKTPMPGASISTQLLIELYGLNVAHSKPRDPWPLSTDVMAVEEQLYMIKKLKDSQEGVPLTQSDSGTSAGIPSFSLEELAAWVGMSERAKLKFVELSALTDVSSLSDVSSLWDTSGYVAGSELDSLDLDNIIHSQFVPSNAYTSTSSTIDLELTLILAANLANLQSCYLSALHNASEIPILRFVNLGT
jgi:hypothetical protein